MTNLQTLQEWISGDDFHVQDFGRIASPADWGSCYRLKCTSKDLRANHILIGVWIKSTKKDDGYYYIQIGTNREKISIENYNYLGRLLKISLPTHKYD